MKEIDGGVGGEAQRQGGSRPAQKGTRCTIPQKPISVFIPLGKHTRMQKKKRKMAGPFEKQISSFPGYFSGINICMRCQCVKKCYQGTSKRSNKLCRVSVGAQEQEGIIKVGA